MEAKLNQENRALIEVLGYRYVFDMSIFLLFKFFSYICKFLKGHGHIHVLMSKKMY